MVLFDIRKYLVLKNGIWWKSNEYLMKIGAKWEKIEGNINSKCINTKKEVTKSLPLDSCGGIYRLQAVLRSQQGYHTELHQEAEGICRTLPLRWFTQPFRPLQQPASHHQKRSCASWRKPSGDDLSQKQEEWSSKRGSSGKTGRLSIDNRLE